MKIELSENEIELIICALEASLDSAKPCSFATSSLEKASALETRREKAKLIAKIKDARRKDAGK